MQTGQILCTRQLHAAQGLHVATMTIYQDYKNNPTFRYGSTVQQQRPKIQCEILFVTDEIKRRGNGCVLPNVGHTGRFLHKTSARLSIPKCGT